MILEVSKLKIRPGKNGEFEREVASAAPIFAAAEGCRSARLLRVEEDPESYLLLVEWDSLEDHTVTFWSSDGFRQWRQKVGEFFSEPARIEHATDGLTILAEADASA